MALSYNETLLYLTLHDKRKEIWKREIYFSIEIVISIVKLSLWATILKISYSELTLSKRNYLSQQMKNRATMRVHKKLQSL